MTTYKPMYDFGYAVLDELARLIVESPAAVAPALWRPIFALGPKGHYAVGHFLHFWFYQITEATVVAEFACRWRPMIEFMLLDEVWAKGGPWYYGEQLERQVLGFSASDYLKRIANHASLIGMMRDLFESGLRSGSPMTKIISQNSVDFLVRRLESLCACRGCCGSPMG